MLFITSKISVLTFRGSVRSFKILICEYKDFKTVLRGSWRPCTPSLVRMMICLKTQAVNINNTQKWAECSTIYFARESGMRSVLDKTNIPSDNQALAFQSNKTGNLLVRL